MMSLPKFSVRNPVIINLFMFAILAGGIYSGLTLVREMFPEARPNKILISTMYPGATPAEIEKSITLRLEERIKDVDGVEKITSSVTEGLSVITAELHSGSEDIDQAVDDIKAVIDSIAPDDFPEDALETQVSRFEPRFPVLMVSLFGDMDERERKLLGERLRDDVLELPEISHVVLAGTRKDEISIEVRPAKLAEFGLSFMDVAQAIAASNLDMPGGQIRTEGANVAVRTLGEKARAEELYSLVIRTDRTGRLVTLRDVATIVDGFEDVEVIGKYNGAAAVTLTIYKTRDEDAVLMSALVRALVAGKMGRPLERSLGERVKAKLLGNDVVQQVYDQARNHPYPPGIGIETHNDLSQFIADRLDLLTRNGAWGLLLVFLSLLVFLHWRVAFWVMMGLILSILGSLICMKLLGQTLNLITAFALIIVLGLLVDDAIIVGEHIYAKVEAGVPATIAAVEGTEEVTGPVVCAILTTIVAFLPLIYIEGQIGDWMRGLPYVVCIALAVSLFEALTILPSHLGHALVPLSRGETPAQMPRRSTWWTRLRRFQGGRKTRLLDVLRARYERLLRTAVHYRYVTMGALVSLLLVIFGLVFGGLVPFVFLQKIDSDTVLARLRMQIGAPVAKTRVAMDVIEQAAMSLPEYKSVYALAGLQISDDGLSVSLRSHMGQAIIELVEGDQRQRTSDEVLRALREKTGDIIGVDKLTFRSIDGGPGGAAIQVDISGDRLEDLVAIAEEMKARLAGFEGVYDIVDDFDAGRPEVQIELFESARFLGLTTELLATQVRAAFYGFEAQKIQHGPEDVKVMVRYPLEFRRHIYDVEAMRLVTPGGELVPFGEVARLTEETGFASINRVNQRRTVAVTADVNEDVANANQVMAVLASAFPEFERRFPGVRLAFGGQRLETARSFRSLKKGFVLALLFIYLILAGLFRSYTQPLIVMAVIPFGLIGAVLGHLVMGYPLTILSMIGTVALTGIVVNDSLILVSFVNRKVRGGVPLIEAVVQGGVGRLRPILLTSATTVLGIAPLLLEQSFQARFLIPMGVAISAGLLFATVLTLLAIPALYLILFDVRRMIDGAWCWVRGRPIREFDPASFI